MACAGGTCTPRTAPYAAAERTGCEHRNTAGLEETAAVTRTRSEGGRAARTLCWDDGGARANAQASEVLRAAAQTRACVKTDDTGLRSTDCTNADFLILTLRYRDAKCHCCGKRHKGARDRPTCTEKNSKLKPSHKEISKAQVVSLVTLINYVRKGNHKSIFLMNADKKFSRS